MNLLKMALDQDRAQWGGDTVWLVEQNTNGKKEGVFLRHAYNAAEVHMHVTGSVMCMTIFRLSFTQAGAIGWIINPYLERDYRRWLEINRKQLEALDGFLEKDSDEMIDDPRERAELIVQEMIKHTPRNEWGDAFPVELAQHISDYASQLSALAAEIMGYADARGGNGCGDSGHDEAMKQAQKERKKVRAALGYTYP